MHLFDHRGYTVKAWVAIAPLIGATLIAVSRTILIYIPGGMCGEREGESERLTHRATDGDQRRPDQGYLGRAGAGLLTER
jgi:hypothetical protein